MYGWPIEILASVSFTTNQTSFAISLPGLTTVSSAVALTYGLDWVFDSTTKLYICSNYQGQTQFQCTVQSLSIWTTYEGNNLKYYFGGLYRKIRIEDNLLMLKK